MFESELMAFLATVTARVMLTFVVMAIAIGILHSVWKYHHQDACWRPCVKAHHMGKVARALDFWLYAEIVCLLVVVSLVLYMIWGVNYSGLSILGLELLVVGMISVHRLRKERWSIAKMTPTRG